MGRNTDKLYVTQSEHSGIDGRHGASTGISQRKFGAVSKRLPFVYCALTLQHWEHPVCVVNHARQATLFDLLAIVPWLQKKGTNPANGEPLEAKDLIKLNFAKNESNEYCDPVTMKVFNDHTHIVAIKHTGNVFAQETMDRLNYKAKFWKDLITDENFTREDVITIQDPHNLADNTIASTVRQGVDTAAGSSLRASERPNTDADKAEKVVAAQTAIKRLREGDDTSTVTKNPTLAYNAAPYSTGHTAASLTSTASRVSTKNERALLSEEQYLLHPKKIRTKGLCILKTSHGNLDLELWPEHAPKAAYNFLKLSKSGYYDNVTFHRNIPGFMIQGGDPTGRGTGGKSIFGRDFEDEISPLVKHTKRGILSMANRGPATNSSQFFLTYDAAPHLDKKHTIFGTVIGDASTLDTFEHHVKDKIVIEGIQVVQDPFDEYLAKVKAHPEKREKTDDDMNTWTNKSIVGKTVVEPTVGKYLNIVPDQEQTTTIAEPVRKKTKVGKFSDFSGW